MRDKLREHLQQQVRECGAEIGAVDLSVLGELGIEDVLTARTVEFERGLARQITGADWQHGLTLAIHARTATKVVLQVLVAHQLESARCDDEACVNEAVEQLSPRFNRLDLLFAQLVRTLRAIVVHRRVHARSGLHLAVGGLTAPTSAPVEYHVQAEVVVGHVLGQTVQVELVLDPPVIYLDEELVALERAEPTDPTALALAALVE